MVMETLVETVGVRKYFVRRPGFLARTLAAAKTRITKAVDGVDLVVGAGETVGLVGESGCGKSTLGRVIVGLHEPTQGQVFYDGEAGTGGQMIFQNPYASLNPRHTVRQIISHALGQRGVPPQERDMEAALLLERVGLFADHLDQYPKQFSGGQRQRIGVARALAMEPKFIVADEPVSALDVSVQAQILNLLSELQAELHISFLLISHDLAVVHHTSQRVAVMYLGKIVETGPTEDIFENPLHPYTQALLAAIPRLGDPPLAQLQLEGGTPTGPDLPTGCRFAPRCPYRRPECEVEEPLKKAKTGSPDHAVWCHLYH